MTRKFGLDCAGSDMKALVATVIVLVTVAYYVTRLIVLSNIARLGQEQKGKED
jgi:hypothetical protein